MTEGGVGRRNRRDAVIVLASARLPAIGTVWGYLDLFRASSVPIRRHVKVRVEATEFDPASEGYFREQSQQRRKEQRRTKATETRRHAPTRTTQRPGREIGP